MADDTKSGAPLELTYTGVFVRSRNHIVVPAIVDKYAEDRRDHALVQHWLENEWVQHLIDDTSLCGVCAIGDSPVQVFNVGVGGKIVVARIPGGEAIEQVDPSPRGPNYSETLRCVKVIGDEVYVGGMARQMYRRTVPGGWVAIDAGTYLPREDRTEAVGFLDLDGHDGSSLCAVGYSGEIWTYDGRSWKQQPSPTDVTLTKVLATSQGDIVVAGLAGTLVRGGRRQWSLIAVGETSDDFWGLCEFASKVYVASSQRVWRLDGDTLAPVDFGLGRDVTCSFLHAADGVLLSVGAKDVLTTHNGVDWVAMPSP